MSNITLKHSAAGQDRSRNGSNGSNAASKKPSPLSRRNPERSQLVRRAAARYSAQGQRAASLRYYRRVLLWKSAIGFSHGLKRTCDVLVSGCALICFSPLFLLIAILIILEDPEGPVFFVQKRVGKWGREFDFPKFRSMVADAEKLKDKLLSQSHHRDSVTFKMKRDPRVTRIGRLLRRTSLDELPQLWCVFIGDMSLVGPRPPVPREVALYTIQDRRRLEIKPGLTCIWQVSGRGDIAFKEQVQLDEQYIQSQSIWLDIKLLLMTVPAVVTGKGAY